MCRAACFARRECQCLGETAMWFALVNALKQLNYSLQDRWGGTPLQDAVREGHDDIVELLKKAGAKV